jgi:hypothetical protein
MNKTEPFFCKWHECGLPWYRKTRQMRIVMAVREIRSANTGLSCSFRWPLRQQTSSKSLRFPAILFVPRLPWRVGATAKRRCGPHQMDVHNRQSPRQNGPCLSPHVQRVIITVQRYCIRRRAEVAKAEEVEAREHANEARAGEEEAHQRADVASREEATARERAELAKNGTT